MFLNIHEDKAVNIFLLSTFHSKAADYTKILLQ